MQVTHPRENPPGSESIGGEEYAVEDGALDLPTWREVNTLARYYGVHPATMREDLCSERLKSGTRKGDPCARKKPCSHHGDEK